MSLIIHLPHHLSYFFFSSLTTDLNPFSWNPRVPTKSSDFPVQVPVQVQVPVPVKPKALKISRRLSARVGDFFRPAPRQSDLSPKFTYAFGVRIHYFLLLTVCHVNFHLQTTATLEEGNQCQMWEFIRVE